jgi:hypothetical protein
VKGREGEEEEEGKDVGGRRLGSTPMASAYVYVHVRKVYLYCIGMCTVYSYDCTRIIVGKFIILVVIIELFHCIFVMWFSSLSFSHDKMYFFLKHMTSSQTPKF